MKGIAIECIKIVNSIKNKELKGKLVEVLVRYEKLSCPPEWEGRVTSLLSASDYCNIYDLSPDSLISKADDLIAGMLEDKKEIAMKKKIKVEDTLGRIERRLRDDTI